MKLITQLVELVFHLLESVLRFVFEFAEVSISQIPKKNKGYKSEFAPAFTLLSSSHYGFCLTGKSNLSAKDSYQNALVVGGTGVGKSSVTLLPSLYSMKGSFIIHDPSGELFSKSAGYLKEKGYEVKALNFANPNISSGYNPLTRAKNSSDIQKISSMLVENALGKSKDPFWNTQAVGLLTMLISVLQKQEEEYQNLYNVRQLLNAMGSKPEAVDALFGKYANDALWTEYKSFLTYDEKVTSGTIATCKAALQIFNDEKVAKVTSFDNLDMEEFRKKKMVLFVQNSVADQRYYAVLTSIFFEQFFSHILSRFPKDNEQDIFFLIDECSSLKLPTLPLAVANVRKHRSGIMLVVQDFNQLIHSYGKHDAEAIRSNCFAKMYFTGQSLETAKELEQTLGKFEYEEENKQTKNIHKVVRSLMTSDEIRTMKATRALLICGHHPPIFAKLKPYYERSDYRRFSMLTLPMTQSGFSLETIPVLPLTAPLHVSHKESEARA